MKAKGRAFPIKTILLVGMASLLFSPAFAQPSLSTHRLILPDTSFLGTIDTAFVTIKNVGTASYTGPVTIYFSTDTVTFKPFTICSSSSLTLNPSDTIRAVAYLGLNPPDFSGGSNIVVVWSSGGTFALPADTVHDSIFVKTQTGIHEKNFNELISVYPTLAKDFINVEFLKDAADNTLSPEAIKVTDIFGRRALEIEISNSGTNTLQINTSKLTSGFYLMEISLPSNRRMVAKFFRQ